MLNFVTPLIVQQAMARGALQAVEVLAQDYVRMVEGQARLMHGVKHRRGEDRFEHPEILATGPDLMDHYGRRHTDVDVERSI